MMRSTVSTRALPAGSEHPSAAGTIVVGLVTALLCLAGCGAIGGRGDTHWLDRDTGLTATIAERVMVFARTEAQYSLSARDYVYLGPVETNRQGLREHFLWVGIATTLDRGFLAPESDLPIAVVATVLDEPIRFALEPWSDLVPGSRSSPVYATKVALYGELGARATLDQIRRIGAAQPTAIRVTYASGRTRVYSAWDTGTGWPEFASGVD